MYILTTKIYTDVWQFFLTQSNNIIHISRAESLNNHRNIYLNDSKIDVDSILFIDNKVINYNSVNTDKVFNIKSEQIISFDSNYSIVILDNNGFGLFEKVSSDWEVTTGYGSIEKDNFDFYFSASYIIMSVITENAYFLCFNDNNRTSVSCFSPEKVDYSWHFTLESLKITHADKILKYSDYQMEVNHFVGVVNGILWMDINVIMNGSFLLGLDAETGKCVHLLDTADNQNEVNYGGLIPNRLPGGTFTTYDEKRNILLGFAHDHFHWQVDLSELSPTIKMWSVEDEMKKHHAFVSAFMNCGISDSHIFFPVGSIGSTPQVFALNRDTLKVDWQYFLTEGGAYYTPTKVEVTKAHLYVLDNTGTLHIFEKTEDN